MEYQIDELTKSIIKHTYGQTPDGQPTHHVELFGTDLLSLAEDRDAPTGVATWANFQAAQKTARK